MGARVRFHPAALQAGPTSSDQQLRGWCWLLQWLTASAMQQVGRGASGCRGLCCKHCSWTCVPGHRVRQGASEIMEGLSTQMDLHPWAPPSTRCEWDNVRIEYTSERATKKRNRTD
eukprot:1161917-Pelagomonas_calceolata.AAC.8